MATPDTVDEQTREAIRHELEAVDRAISMVAQHHAYRMTLGGLRFGPQILAVVRDSALPIGVRVVPLWQLDSSYADLRVESTDEVDGADEAGG